VRDERLIDITEDPLSPREQYRAEYLKRPVERLPRDVTHAFDRLYRLERQNDELRRALLDHQRDSAKQERSYHWLKIWAWILAAAVTAEFAAIGGLTSWILDRVMTK
jgi:hypothetical protein